MSTLRAGIVLLRKNYTSCSEQRGREPLLYSSKEFQAFTVAHKVTASNLDVSRPGPFEH
jgi:hypothetical protein